ncbi:hypothetical protein FRC12_001398 [Ceratobasidium sp. 428]|nr:hypothetical protein FRC12_001398 [Ceratobasidium sp. 428]
MPGPSGSNPSTVLQAQKAQGDAIDNLKRKYSRMSDTVSKLEENLDKFKNDNKLLVKKVRDLEDECQNLSSQLDETLEKQSHLQQFRTRATRLLRALAAGQTYVDVQNQLITKAITSGDANAYFVALERLGDDADNDGDEEGDQNSQADDENHAPGAGGTATLPQEEIVDSRLLMVCPELALRRSLSKVFPERHQQLPIPSYGCS